MEIKRKSVVFNLEDEFQHKMFQHCNRQSNFSNYIKRLVQRDMEGGSSLLSPGHMMLNFHQEPDIEPDLGSFF